MYVVEEGSYINVNLISLVFGREVNRVPITVLNIITSEHRVQQNAERNSGGRYV